MFSFLQLLSKLGFIETIESPLSETEVEEAFAIKILLRSSELVPHVQAAMIEFLADTGYKVESTDIDEVKIEIQVEYVGKVEASLHAITRQYLLPFYVAGEFNRGTSLQYFKENDIGDEMRQQVFSLIGKKIADLGMEGDQWIPIFAKALDLILGDDFSAVIGEESHLLKFKYPLMAQCIYHVLVSFLKIKGYDTKIGIRLADSSIKITTK